MPWLNAKSQDAGFASGIDCSNGMEDWMEKTEVKEASRSADQEVEKTERSADSIFAIEEIQIEELAVDGICGVY